jgi:ubiquinone/menaquinone biosynthesis C-methylase UbiE
MQNNAIQFWSFQLNRRNWRKTLVCGLEIDGANFVHYDPGRVTKLFALEPNPGMIRLAERQMHQTKLKVEFLDLPGERIPLEDGTVDTVVSTFTLCTIPGIAEAIRGIRRVLKPDGELIFFELGLSADPAVQRWHLDIRRIKD